MAQTAAIVMPSRRRRGSRALAKLACQISLLRQCRLAAPCWRGSTRISRHPGNPGLSRLCLWENVANFGELVAQLNADKDKTNNSEAGKYRSYHNIIDHPGANIVGDDLLEIRNHYVISARAACLHSGLSATPLRMAPVYWRAVSDALTPLRESWLICAFPYGCGEMPQAQARWGGGHHRRVTSPARGCGTPKRCKRKRPPGEGSDGRWPGERRGGLQTPGRRLAWAVWDQAVAV